MTRVLYGILTSPAFFFLKGVQTTHGEETQSSHKQVFGPVKISSGELLQHQCKYAGFNIRV